MKGGREGSKLIDIALESFILMIDRLRPVHMLGFTPHSQVWQQQTASLEQIRTNLEHKSTYPTVSNCPRRGPLLV